MRQLFFISILLIHVGVCFPQSTIDRKLQKKIESLVKGFGGDIGVYVYNLKKNTSAGINIDTVFPTASMIKVPILVGIMNKIHTGELNYRQELIYQDSLLYAGVDILGSFKNDEKIELSKVIMLMLTMSDNTASLWLQSLAGSGLRINELMNSLGFPVTRVNSRTPGREHFRELNGWGQTSPKEMATLIKKIYNQEVISATASNQMMRLLSRNYWDEQGLSAIPPTIQVFSKNGAVNTSRSEVLLVNAPKTPYVFCICTKKIKDERWTSDNEAWQLTRKLSALLWDYYH